MDDEHLDEARPSGSGVSSSAVDGAPPPKDPKPPERIAFAPGEIPAMVGLGRTVVERALREKELKSRRHGRRRVVLREDLLEWLRGLPEG